MTALWLVLGVLTGLLLIWLAARWQDRRREDWHLPDHDRESDRFCVLELPEKRGWPADGSPAIPPGHGEIQYIICPRCKTAIAPMELLDGEACPKCKLVL